ncbi:DUF2061 domain-containing protein [Vibrio sp.]|uniref:DUF2061 domain-containing protein n=1 Tax=Vibrio sp. TaxID=678 RepID=UPI003D14B9B4
MKKTINFAAIHFTIAFTLAYLLTGDILFGSLIAMIEPMINSLAFYAHEVIWKRANILRRMTSSAQIKTVSFATIHFSVAVGVVYLITGDLLVGGVLAVIEPACNTVAYFFHERFWRRRHPEASLSAQSI